MRYLITIKNSIPFLTNWFESDNHFNDNVEMIVYDLIENKYTKDGYVWKKIKVDHL